jgi:membrane protein
VGLLLGARLRVLSERVIRRATGFDLADWRRIGSGTRARMRQERLGLVAAAIGFWGTISLLPSLIVLLTIYGLIAEVGDIQRQVERVLGSISEEARSVVTSQLRSVVESTGLGWGLVAGLVAVFWTASSGMANAIKAVALAYGDPQPRSFLRLRLLAIAFTLCSLVVASLAVGIAAGAPLAFDVPWLAAAIRWLGLTLLVASAVATLYRFAPQRRHGGWEWAIKGALAVAVAWAAVTGAFSVYVRELSTYGGTYGALAGLVILMFWFYLTGFIVVGGAALSAEMWHQRVGRGDPPTRAVELAESGRGGVP